MCECCHMEYCCLHGRGRFRPFYYEPGPYYMHEPLRERIYRDERPVRQGREYLRQEMEYLEKRLNEIKSMLEQQEQS